jgi:hypothetical protein
MDGFLQTSLNALDEKTLQKGGKNMKKFLVMTLMLGVSLSALTGSAYAICVGPNVTACLPEPGILTLLGAGIAGIGLYSFKGKNRK